jgi:dGTPase
MRTYGGFEGNAQTIRILTHLEKYYRGLGIRGTRRLILGVLKYPVAYGEYGAAALKAKPPKCFYDADVELITKALSIFSQEDVRTFRSLGPDGRPQFKTFDCSIMELADDIAYGVHDLEDGIGRGLLHRDRAGEEILAGFADAGVDKIRDISVDGIVEKLFSAEASERKHAISLLVGYFIISIDVGRRDRFASPLLDLMATVPAATRKLLDHLSKEITYKGIVRRREVQTLEFKGERIITDLFDAFAERPLSLVGLATLDPFDDGAATIFAKLQEGKGEGQWRDLDEPSQRIVARAICDFIAGMTNPYAEKYHRRLFEPGYGSSTDEL